MTEELKKRIAQINAGTAPAGYKKTKVGIVPEEWEVVRFAKISQKTGTERNAPECTYPIYSINNKVGFAPQEDQFENDGYSNTSKDLYRVVRKGEFAYNPARINVGSIGLLEDEEAVIISSLYVCFRLNEKCHNPYYWQYFKSYRFNYDVNNYTEGSVREYLFYDNFSKIRVVLPPLPEQQKIAEILTAQDRVITLIEKQIELLQKQKKAFLQKLFPKKGSKYPEIRFEGFTDAWEQRKCSDFIKLVGGATPSKANKDYWNGDIVWLSSQEIKGGFVNKGTYNITQKAVDDNTTKMIPANTPMFISRSGILANSFPITRALCDVAINQDIKALLFDHTVFSSDYIVHYLESKEQFILKSIVKSGTTVQSVSIPDFEKMLINIPASKDEQDRIGLFFEKLDTLIALHQRKLEIEQQKKKALMQLLLTGKVRCK